MGWWWLQVCGSFATATNTKEKSLMAAFMAVVWFHQLLVHKDCHIMTYNFLTATLNDPYP